MVLRIRGVYLLSHYSVMSAVCSLGFSVVSTKINLAEKNNVLEERDVSICMVKVHFLYDSHKLNCTKTMYVTLHY